MKLHVILWFVACLVIHGADGDTSCPDNWMPFQGFCYLFGFDQRLPFTEAQHFCQQHGATLAHVKNVHERNFIRNFVSHAIHYPWWIGLNDQLIEGEYRWIDTDTAPEYTDWAPGYPLSTNRTYNQDCICLQPGDFQWHDTDCIAPFKPVCQKLSTGGGPTVG